MHALGMYPGTCQSQIRIEDRGRWAETTLNGRAYSEVSASLHSGISSCVFNATAQSRYTQVGA
eukprot:6960668-Prymnesium_polylepis.1